MASQEYFKKYYKDNIDKYKKQGRRWYLEHLEEIKEKRTKRNRPHYQENKEHLKKYAREYNQRIRNLAIDALGGSCMWCGNLDRRVLQFDHINGGGVRERKTVKGLYASMVYKSIMANENKFQLLCANCNWIKKYENNENIKAKAI